MRRFLKNILIILILFFSNILTASNKNKLDKEKPIAIMSIITNLTINWINENPDQYISSANSCTLLYDDLERIIEETIKEQGFKLIPKEIIISMDEYKNAEESKLYLQNDFYCPKGYKRIPLKNKISPIISERTNSKYFFYFNIKLEKVMNKGFDKNGLMNAVVTINLDITNEFGKIIKSIKNTVISEEVLQVVDGKYNMITLRSFFPNIIKAATTNVIAAL